MAAADSLAQPTRKLSSVIKAIASHTSVSMLAGAALMALFRLLLNLWNKWKATQAERMWKRHLDLDEVMACIFTTEHLQTLGRIEKRTLFVKPLSSVFVNEYMLSKIIQEAERAVSGEHDPFIVTRLSPEDKWHVLNTCSNHLSSCFAPYHVFFNEARRTESDYKSAWYCFTLTCAQTEASGRWFITPHKPVGQGDVGTMRIRIILMNEEELREIASGAIEPPPLGLFNERHASRWKTMCRFAELFQRELIQDKAEDAINVSPTLSSRQNKYSVTKLGSSPSHQDIDARSQPEQEANPVDARERNSMLRLHVPFHASANSENMDCSVTKDVVLYD